MNSFFVKQSVILRSDSDEESFKDSSLCSE